jgi:thymidylate synthase (FAD)
MESEKFCRPNSNILDKMIGEKLEVLDNGFIRIIDYMGTDASIVQAARVSYGEGTKKVSEDRALIRYLMRNQHTSPFEMCEIKLHVRVPMDCWRQWIRHRTANVNEYSTRYSIAIDSARKTKPEEWRLQASNNKQGSTGQVDLQIGKQLSKKEEEIQTACRNVYEERINLGIAREQARTDLPLSTYTEAYWKIDLHNLFHFLELRMDEKAQYEIRQYANVIGYNIVANWVPLTWEAFLDYRFNPICLSNIETQIINRILRGDSEEATQIAITQLGLSVDLTGDKKSREVKELEMKLNKLGLMIPW